MSMTIARLHRRPTCTPVRIVVARRRRRSRRSRPQTGMRSSAASRCCPMRSCPRCTRPAARRPPPAGGRAIVTAWRGDALVGAMPLYVKTHSYGEYVFDWAWADAYRRHGRRYYPKLRRGDPVHAGAGPAPARARRADARRRCSRARCDCCARRRSRRAIVAARAVPDARGSGAVRARRDDHPPRRAVPLAKPRLPRFRRLPRRVQSRQAQEDAAGAAPAARSRRHLRRKAGGEITAARLGVLLPLLRATYRAHRSTPYLSLDFFVRIGATMPTNLLLVVGERDGLPLCAALDIFDDATLWGRYWGDADTCRACISRPVTTRRSSSASSAASSRFEGGAQGAHKLARGLLPVTTHSAHAIADPRFRAAIAILRARARRRRARSRRARGARARSGARWRRRRRADRPDAALAAIHATAG